MKKKSIYPPKLMAKGMNSFCAAIRVAYSTMKPEDWALVATEILVLYECCLEMHAFAEVMDEDEKGETK